MHTWYKFIIYSLIYFVKNYSLLKMIDYGTRNKEYIHKENGESKEHYKHEFLINIIGTSMFNSLTTIFIMSFYNFPNTNYTYDLLTFIPSSFLFEIVFDFGHYWMHRIIHSNRLLYKYIHKKHHVYHHTSSVTTFYHHPLDLFFTNVCPFILALYIVPLSLYQMAIIDVYKMFIEISGHTGKKLYPISSFPQFMWLPKYLGIELYSEDHCIHHTHYRYNYAKRFSLWDKLFGTFYKETNLVK